MRTKDTRILQNGALAGYVYYSKEKKWKWRIIGRNEKKGGGETEIIKELEIAINIFQPNIIYTHHYGDLNVDHRLTHQAVLTACRPFPESLITKIYTFEVMSSTDWALTGSFQFIPNTFINITNYIDTWSDIQNLMLHQSFPK